MSYLFWEYNELGKAIKEKIMINADKYLIISDFI